MMKYITFSRHFPKGHPKAGEPTHFVQKILHSIVAPDFAPATNIGWPPKHHTIRTGSRFKPGETISLRVWSGLPYRSKQIEFAQVEVKKVWEVEINNRFGKASFEVVINGVIYGQLHYGNDNDVNETGLISLAKNDGLELDDFVNWLEIHPKKEGLRFNGQIIAWSPDINY